jgi:predicted nucleic acid-binding protein
MLFKLVWTMELQLTYDGCYVALSEQVKAPLLTLDERLVNSLTGSRFDVRK